jgi:hypothetical protein
MGLSEKMAGFKPWTAFSPKKQMTGSIAFKIIAVDMF